MGSPSHAPFIDIVLAGVIRIRPADRSQQQILVQGQFQVVGVAAAVRIVLCTIVLPHVFAQPHGELRCEADLHGAAVGLFVVQCQSDAISMFHDLLLAIEQLTCRNVKTKQ